jgi:hypothetical protein
MALGTDRPSRLPIRGGSHRLQWSNMAYLLIEAVRGTLVHSQAHQVQFISYADRALTTIRLGIHAARPSNSGDGESRPITQSLSQLGGVYVWVRLCRQGTAKALAGKHGR